MKEDFLHYLFKTKQLGNEFYSINDEFIRIENFGTHNFNAGPDFLNTQVKFDNILWAGHIEFHVKSSDWYLHKHQNDPAYKNVILHMVYEFDKKVLINETPITTVEIKNIIPKPALKNYTALLNNSTSIACANQLNSVDQIFLNLQKEKALYNRLERKTESTLTLFKNHYGDKFKVLMIMIAGVFGGKVNKEPFIELVEKLDYKWIGKLNFDKFKIESLLFGLAGFLSNPIDDYSKKMNTEFQYLSNIFKISPMNPLVWKHSRMRPFGFPEIRIAQFSGILATPNFQNELFKTFKDQNIESPSNYWDNHFRLGVITKNKNTRISSALYDLVQINGVVPFQFAQGILHDNQEMKLQAVELLTKINPEKNSIITDWKKLNVPIENAYDSQAMIEQKNEWCIAKKCLFCSVGNEVLKN